MEKVKEIILYTLAAGFFFLAGRSIDYNKPEEQVVVYIIEEKTIEYTIQPIKKDDITFKLRRNNYKKIDEEIYFGIDLENIIKKYHKAKEWVIKKY